MPVGFYVVLKLNVTTRRLEYVFLNILKILNILTEDISGFRIKVRADLTPGWIYPGGVVFVKCLLCVVGNSVAK